MNKTLVDQISEGQLEWEELNKVKRMSQFDCLEIVFSFLSITSWATRPCSRLPVRT
jgi:hypothetical protein